MARTGKVLVPVGNGRDYGQSVYAQADGKIVVAGSSLHLDGMTDSGDPTGHNLFALMRFNPNGSLDTTLGEVATNINFSKRT